jgi:4-hydroxy-tetrahydrodipicolinate synthase
MTRALIGPDTRGVFVIAATPFTDDGRIDEPSIGRMVEFYRSKGADGLTILGMMGEAPKLTQQESLLVIERVLAAAGDMPVVVGVSAPGLAALGELSHRAMGMGAAGVMVAPPGAVRTDDQIVEYYQQAAQAAGADTPMVLQDFPLSTNVVISTTALGRVIETTPSMVMLKHEDWPGLAKITALRQAEAKGRRRISILCGNAGMFLPEEMQRGADGAMTGFGFPEMMVEVCRLTTAGDMDRARDIFDAYLPLMRYEQQPSVGLAVRKYVLAKRGAIASAAQRAPGAALAPAAAREVDALLERQGRRLQALGL